jgi:hypothetical protein
MCREIGILQANGDRARGPREIGTAAGAVGRVFRHV